MVFKRLLGALGVGAPKVDTILTPGPVYPGGTLTGEVHMLGGSASFDIQGVSLEFAGRVEVETEDYEGHRLVGFHKVQVGGAFRIAEEERRSIPFQIPVPWETPVTEMYGRQLGIGLGVRTELAVAGAIDAGDMDPVSVLPLPSQEGVLDALGRMGFIFKSADLEAGRIRGTNQQLPFYQEIEMAPAPQYHGVMNELEITFLASPAGLEVILEADKRGGLFRSGGDVIHRYTVPHEAPGQRDWVAEVDGWIRSMVERRGGFF
ncbi:sporulation protein [Streptomyces aidingensis]|uniref:Sporulation-control protein n=1 Tax=Streptomyces aidingensis TaxID=910347 RepID=A0A1I1QEB3_9ACTN|nr:sporulation-control protein [Streptomyces aidingensis]